MALFWAKLWVLEILFLFFAFLKPLWILEQMLFVMGGKISKTPMWVKTFLWICFKNDQFYVFYEKIKFDAWHSIIGTLSHFLNLSVLLHMPLGIIKRVLILFRKIISSSCENIIQWGTNLEFVLQTCQILLQRDIPGN